GPILDPNLGLFRFHTHPCMYSVPAKADVTVDVNRHPIVCGAADNDKQKNPEKRQVPLPAPSDYAAS
ncbi:MAG: hypothetical protein ACYTAS_15555, partial [Planctomycetota bacterium]